MKWFLLKKKKNDNTIKRRDHDIRSELSKPRSSSSSRKSLGLSRILVDEASGLVSYEKESPIIDPSRFNWPVQTQELLDADYIDPDTIEFVRQGNSNGRDTIDFQTHINECKNSRVRGRQGPRSLLDTAVEVVLKNISNVTFEGLDCLPLLIIKRMWQDLNKRTVINFHTWKIFSKLLREEDHATLNLFRYRQDIKAPVPSLDVYKQPLLSNSFDFLTHLSITTAFSLPELVRLSSLTNLGALEIVNPQETFNSDATPFAAGIGDRLIRAWHEAAVKNGAFPVLRILKFRNFKALTNRSLGYLNSFPALAVYDVADCGFDVESKTDAQRLGWKATVEGDILGLLEAACVERAVLMQGHMGLPIRPIRRACALQLSDSALVKMVSRVDIPSFLTQTEASDGELKDLNHTGNDYNTLYENLNNMQARNPNKQIKKHTWEVLDTLVHSKTRALETWEFRTLTSFCRVGELRNDKDLKNAGVVVGDQAVVGKDLISSTPVVSIRLGPGPSSPSSPLRRNDLHRPFYSSMHGESAASSFKYTWKDDTTKRPRGLCFIRIRVPSKNKSSTQTRNNSTETCVLGNEKSEPSVKNASTNPGELAPSMPSHWHIKRARSDRTMRVQKKQKLADVLSSFM